MPAPFIRNDAVRRFCLTHPTFHPDAYYLVQQAVSLCPKYLKGQRPAQHVTGQALLTVIRKYLLELYGPLTIDVLDHWNIHKTADFGRIVYDLVELRLLGVSEDDSIHDFDDGFDFIEAFVLPFK